MNKSQWNSMVAEHAPPFGAFLQSWDWGEFQRHVGREVKRIDHVSEAGRMMAQAIRMPLPFKQSYWMISKGPLGKLSIEQQVAVLREELSDAAFLRFEPLVDPGLLRGSDVQPSTTLVLDLTGGEEAVLAEMKSKTRYNVRLAKRKGVVCKTVGLEHFDDFVRLMQQTSARDQFRAFPASYYRTMLEVLQGSDTHAFLAMAFFEDRPVAANIMIDFAGMRTYLHGSSSNLHRNVMAPYALHWHLISDAIAKGMKGFDFWGIAPEDAPEDHKWAGITRYKKGFGGTVVSMPGTFDLPVEQLLYAFYKLSKRLRSITSR